MLPQNGVMWEVQFLLSSSHLVSSLVLFRTAVTSTVAVRNLSSMSRPVEISYRPLPPCLWWPPQVVLHYLGRVCIEVDRVRIRTPRACRECSPGRAHRHSRRPFSLHNLSPRRRSRSAGYLLSDPSPSPRWPRACRPSSPGPSNPSTCNPIKWGVRFMFPSLLC